MNHDDLIAFLKSVLHGAEDGPLFDPLKRSASSSWDLLWRNLLIEVKTGNWSATAPKLRQLEAGVAAAAREGWKTAYVFLSKPGTDVVETLESVGVTVFYLLE
jgi:hypothetical protein